jgi:putative urate catabolism protein
MSLRKTTTRDFIGYGETPPHADWPGGARIAVNFVLNIEEGAEYSIGDGDGRSESALTEVAAARVPSGDRDLAAESMYEYGARAGFWRLARLFRGRGLPLTAFACALAIERNPEIAALIRQQEWDVCCHGYRWIEHYRLDRQEEQAQIARAVASLEQTLGQRPYGWYSRYAPSVNTREVLVQEGGFLYDSDSYADDLPYWAKVNDRNQLVVPYSLVTNDAKLVNAFTDGDTFFRTLRDAFDTLYAEGEERPRMMSVGMHPRILGQPARTAGLVQFLDHVQAHDKVWICRRLDIARHWATRFALPSVRAA